uniref:Uncharacterized protein n=1 Tax=Heterorhabditis bacteriophora TaxID=37862 RepID=A0A1I7WGG3_HETBA
MPQLFISPQARSLYGTFADVRTRLKEKYTKPLKFSVSHIKILKIFLFDKFETFPVVYKKILF